MIDSHCHLTYISEEKNEIIEIINRAKENNINYIVDIGVHPTDLDKRYNILGDMDNIYMTAGFYPDYAYSYKEEELFLFKDKVASMNKNKRNIYMIGEIGLDYYHNSEATYKQRDFFERLINIANILCLPISIHTREAWDDTLAILSNTNVNKLGIIHCFSGSRNEAKKLLDLGYIISFSGILTYNKNIELREVAKYVPTDMFCIETDAPYLSPQTKRGKKNEPSFLIHTAEAIAIEKSISIDRILEFSYSNTMSVLQF